VRFLVAAALALLVLAGCSGGQGVSYDKEVDALGAHIVADLKAHPMIADASYVYDHGLDLGQYLKIRADVTDASALQPAIDVAERDFWLSPANVGHLTVTVFQSGQQLGSDNVEDSPTFDRPRMEQKYGPRPKH
jgi:hypothetical protein